MAGTGTYATSTIQDKKEALGNQARDSGTGMITVEKIAVSYKILTRHQFVFDKWSRSNSVRKVDDKILANHSPFSSLFSRGGVAFLAGGLSTYPDATGIVDLDVVLKYGLPAAHRPWPTRRRRK